LRAGLLSEKEVVGLINENFVSTWVLIDVIKSHAGKGNLLADTLASNWEYPLDLMFLKTNGEFVAKLNSFRDFPNAHVDVGFPNRVPDGLSHTETFLRRANEVLGDRLRRAPTPSNQGLTEPPAAHSESR
jgi:hypothetical protein